MIVLENASYVDTFANHGLPHLFLAAQSRVKSFGIEVRH